MAIPNLTGHTLEGYNIGKKLGKGSFGEVYKATKHEVNYAIKVFARPTDYDEELRAFKALSEYALNGCNPQILCEYENFTVNVGSYMSPINVGMIVMEYMDGSLDSYLDSRFSHKAPTNLLVRWMGQLLEGFSYIHGKGYAYRDLKLGNTMFKGDNVKIGDLGFVCNASAQPCEPTGTYLPPEAVKMQNLNPIPNMTLEQAQKMDIWLLGLMFWKLAFGRDEFPYIKVTDKRFNTRGPRLNIRQDNVRESYYTDWVGRMSAKSINYIIDSMLKVQPNDRKSMSDLSDYFKNEMSGCKIDNDPNPRSRATVIQQFLDLGLQVTTDAGAVIADPQSVPLNVLCSQLRDKTIRRQEISKCAVARDRIFTSSRNMIEQLKNEIKGRTNETSNLQEELARLRIDYDKLEITEGCRIFNKIFSDEDMRDIYYFLDIDSRGQNKKRLCEDINKYLTESKDQARTEITRNIIRTCSSIQPDSRKSNMEINHIGARLKKFAISLKETGNIYDYINAAEILNATRSEYHGNCVKRFLHFAGEKEDVVMIDA